VTQCYSLADRASKQDLDSVSSWKQRTNQQKQSTLSTMYFLVYYTYTTRAMGVTTLWGLWVTTLTLSSPQKNVLSDMSKLNCLQYL